MMKSLICISFILLSLVSTLEGQSPHRVPVSDKRVIEVAEFVVSIKGRPDVVYDIVQGSVLPILGGGKYDLVISAKDSNGKTKNYRAVVSRVHTVPPTMTLLFYGEE